MHYANVV